MRSDLVQSTLIERLQETCRTEQEAFLESQKCSLGRPGDQAYQPRTTESLYQTGETQELYIGGLRRRQRLSPMVWRLIVIVGDGVLFTTLFIVVLVLAAPFHVTSHILGDVLSVKNTTLIWACLALLSWNTAVNIIKAQDL